MFDLNGKVALISGAASGIGAATAVRFATAGADVALTWFEGDPHDAGPVVDAVEQSGGRALLRSCNVSDTEQVQRVVAETVEELGRLDIVVANAGIARDVGAAELSDDQWDTLLDVNLAGVFRFFRAAIPTMRAQRHGRLLTTSSIAGGVQGWARHAHYCASKGGLVGLVRGLAVELGVDGITVNAIAPGVIATPQALDPVNSLGAEGVEAFGDSVPVGRSGHPEDIAALFHYLASDEAEYLTGQVITVDGGVSLSLV